MMDSLYSHSSHLLQQLQEQRIQGMLCDCMLVVKGVCFKAHKNVLAAFSSYFRSLFQNPPGQKNDVFHLVIQDVGGIGQILDYMYTSHLEVNQDNAQALLDIAQCLQVNNILNMCNAFLKPCSAPAADPAFSLPPILTHEHTDCVLGSGLAPEVDLHCSSTDTQKHALCPSVSDPLRRAQAGMPQATAPLEVSSSIPDKQPLHGYKLRNFYSKQYFKQSAVQTCNISSSLGQGQQSPLVVDGQLSTGTTSVSLPSQMPVCPPDTPPTAPATQGFNPGHVDGGASYTTSAARAKSPPANRPMRPKKTVYLKKYNYLRSQSALEELGQLSSQTVDTCPTIPHQEGQPLSQPEGTPVAEGVSSDQTEECLRGAEPQIPSPPTVEPEDMERQDTAERSEVMANSNKYCCEMCGKTFKHPSNLELHKRSHTGEKPFQCNICGKHFSQAGNLQTHLRRHSGEKPYICELCGKSFAASGDVQRHISVHSGARPHLCDICGRGFSNFSNLKEHKKTHTTDKEFTCDQCGKSFNMHRKLLKHKMRHTGEKPYTCQTCGKSFAGSGDLQRHTRSHTGERPYVCDRCGKSFTRTAVLRRHRNSLCKPAPEPPPDEKTPDEPPTPTSRHKPPLSSERHAPILPPQGVGRPASAHLVEPPSSMLVLPHPSSSSTSSFSELRSIVPPHLLAPQTERCLPPDLPKPPKPHLPAPFSSYAQENSAGGVDKLPAAPPRPTGPLPTSDGHCCLPLTNRTNNSAPYRASEGAFGSSGALWGLAMKTLQSDSEMEP